MHILKIRDFSAPACFSLVWGWEQSRLLCLSGRPCSHPSTSMRGCADGTWHGTGSQKPSREFPGVTPSLSCPVILTRWLSSLSAPYRCCHRAAPGCQAREDHLGELCRCVPVIRLETRRDLKAMFFVQAWSAHCVGVFASELVSSSF